MTAGHSDIVVRIKALAHARGLPKPAYQTADAAGLDLVAALPAKSPLVLMPGGRALVPTGLQFALPSGTEAQIRPRSGLALKHGVTVLNSPGTIDADYRGEVQIILVNLSDTPFTIQRGDRIAQMIIAPISQATIKIVARLDTTMRGSGGFGSTGVTPASPTAKKASGKSKGKTDPLPRQKRKAGPARPGKRAKKRS